MNIYTYKFCKKFSHKGTPNFYIAACVFLLHVSLLFYGQIIATNVVYMICVWRRWAYQRPAAVSGLCLAAPSQIVRFQPMRAKYFRFLTNCWPRKGLQTLPKTLPFRASATFGERFGTIPMTTTILVIKEGDLWLLSW